MHACDRGFTLIELLAVTVIGSTVTMFALFGLIAQKGFYEQDIAKTTLNQNMRGAMDILAAGIRGAGESLPAFFPSVEVIPGVDGAADQLILRRNIKEEVLKLCLPIVANSSTTDIAVAIPGDVPGCTYGSNTHNFTTWADYRDEKGGLVRAYLYNQSTRQGEFFEYIDESDSGDTLLLERSSGTWAFDYPVEASVIYLLEQWQFQLDDGEGDLQMLQIVNNNDVDNPLSVASGIINLDADFVMSDGAVKNALDDTDSMADVQIVRIQLTGSQHWKTKQFYKERTGDFFPRNVLSY